MTSAALVRFRFAVSFALLGLALGRRLTNLS